MEYLGKTYNPEIFKFTFWQLVTCWSQTWPRFFNRRSLHFLFPCPSCSAITTVMAAVARFLIRGANSKLSVPGIGAGAQSSYGATLLKLSATCNACTKPQRRHVAHFTFQPDPIPSQYGEWLANRLTLPGYQERFSKTLTQVWDEIIIEIDHFFPWTSLAPVVQLYGYF